ncbi:MAG TPA: hypothetical protein VFK02_30005 [Kofleriaceae bacterium]|nr:hypothetical protein [Kofleriaceae bacterium]
MRCGSRCLVGALLDRGAAGATLVERRARLGRELRGGLGADERLLVVERDPREDLAGGLAVRDGRVHAPTLRGERRLGALLFSDVLVVDRVLES